MILVCGIHGVGKTYYCQKESKKLNIPYFTASELIKKRKEAKFKEKEVSNIEDNQRFLIEEISKIQKNFILDGHLCLLDYKNKISRIPIEIFSKMNIECVIVIVNETKQIQNNLINRSEICWDEKFIDSFQKKEIEYAKEITKKLNIDLVITKGYNKKNFNRSIVLPIKPIYAERILKNEKKYEFRKKICNSNIDKIYLYATNPVKRIVGEVYVEEKIMMDKDKLWDLTKEKAGIDYEYYRKYYEKNQKAAAYKLGNVKKYEKIVTLQDFGIEYVPQSYVYV